jgi:hypothetical protein
LVLALLKNGAHGGDTCAGADHDYRSGHLLRQAESRRTDEDAASRLTGSAVL